MGLQCWRSGLICARYRSKSRYRVIADNGTKIAGLGGIEGAEGLQISVWLLIFCLSFLTPLWLIGLRTTDFRPILLVSRSTYSAADWPWAWPRETAGGESGGGSDQKQRLFSQTIIYYCFQLQNRFGITNRSHPVCSPSSRLRIRIFYQFRLSYWQKDDYFCLVDHWGKSRLQSTPRAPRQPSYRFTVTRLRFRGTPLRSSRMASSNSAFRPVMCFSSDPLGRMLELACRIDSCRVICIKFVITVLQISLISSRSCICLSNTEKSRSPLTSRPRPIKKPAPRLVPPRMYPSGVLAVDRSAAFALFMPLSPHTYFCTQIPLPRLTNRKLSSSSSNAPQCVLWVILPSASLANQSMVTGVRD